MFLSKAEVRPRSGTCHMRTFLPRTFHFTESIGGTGITLNVCQRPMWVGMIFGLRSLINPSRKHRVDREDHIRRSKVPDCLQAMSHAELLIKSHTVSRRTQLLACLSPIFRP